MIPRENSSATSVCMNQPVPPDVGAALRALRERFRSASAPTLARFERIASGLAQAPASPSGLADLERELHRVRGTAGSYGYMDVSRLAGTLEERVATWAGDPALDLEERAVIVEQFVITLRLAFERPDHPPAAPEAP